MIADTLTVDFPLTTSKTRLATCWGEAAGDHMKITFPSGIDTKHWKASNLSSIILSVVFVFLTIKKKRFSVSRKIRVSWITITTIFLFLGVGDNSTPSCWSQYIHPNHNQISTPGLLDRSQYTCTTSGHERQVRSGLDIHTEREHSVLCYPPCCRKYAVILLISDGPAIIVRHFSLTHVSRTHLKNTTVLKIVQPQAEQKL